MNDQRAGESLLGWLSFAFGVALVMSPEIKSFAMMGRAAPLALWGGVFIVLGIAHMLASECNLWRVRFACECIGVVMWGCALAAYVSQMLEVKTFYPTQAFAMVCMVHSALYAVRLWRSR